MTKLFNDPAQFVDEALAGFVAANRATIAAVPGGVVRNEQRDGGVTVITGGGSGHYPAFAGLVGQGLAHGAAVGNVFASPSVQQIYSVAKAAEQGRGVLFTFGNYTGDVLNFTAAAERLEADGISCRIVPVTDDIASATADEAGKRRGVGGGLVVYKMAGRAADEGRSLDDVTRVAEHANDRTRSIGVAMSGCTLPGSDEPLFSLPAGRMSVGMGVHGEPGISERDLPSANELAELLVSNLLSEVPDGVGAAGGSAAVILNGLGTIKYEELFVVYRRVDELLRYASVDIIEPEVGEFTTSFDMAGVSLTMCWLDDELSDLWLAPASSPAFKRGDIRRVGGAESPEAAGHTSDVALDTEPVPAATGESMRAAVHLVHALSAARDAVNSAVTELGRLDAVAGDGDHGIGMQRGAQAAVDEAGSALAAGAGAGTVLQRCGDAWSAAGGGTSGMLWGVLLGSVGRVLGDEDAVTPEKVSEAIGSAASEIQRVGDAEVGDKTLVDALVPFAESFESSIRSGSSLADAWQSASEDASAAAEASAALVPKVGRARPLADKSVGSPDPGAVSLALILTAVGTALPDRCDDQSEAQE